MSDTAATGDGTVEGFDPKFDDPATADHVRIRMMYERLRERGKEGAAAELRQEPDLDRQRRLLETYSNFDPDTTSRNSGRRT